MLHWQIIFNIGVSLLILTISLENKNVQFTYKDNLTPGFNYIKGVEWQTINYIKITLHAKYCFYSLKLL